MIDEYELILDLIFFGLAEKAFSLTDLERMSVSNIIFYMKRYGEANVEINRQRKMQASRGA